MLDKTRAQAMITILEKSPSRVYDNHDATTGINWDVRDELVNYVRS